MINKYLLSGLLLSISVTASARPSQTMPSVDADVGQFFHLDSHDISPVDSHNDGKQFRLYIAVPQGISSPRPVLYMLDGNGMFPLMVNQAIRKLPVERMPIIVGIGYASDQAFPKKWRDYDYTPQVSDPDFAYGGGAEQLYTLLESKIKPWVTAHYPADSNRQTLFGHSFGGLFTLMAYQNHPESFQRFVAASPSLWWGKGEMIDLPLMTKRQVTASLFVTQGGGEEKPDLEKMDEKQLARYHSRTSWIGPRALCSALEANHHACQFTLYPGKNHGSVIPDALGKALDVAALPDSL